MQDDDDREAHAACLRQHGTRAPRGLGPAQRRDLRAAGLEQARAERRIAGHREQRIGQARGVAGRDVQRAVAEHLAEDGQVADDRRRTRREALDRRQPEALEPRRQDDRERAGVERAEVVDPAQPADPRAVRIQPALAGDHELGRRPRARARWKASASTSGALRGSSAPTKRK